MAITYYYECRKCGHEWKREQGINDKPEKVCPVCGEPEAKRVVCGSGAFVLNGTCWAKDSYS